MTNREIARVFNGLGSIMELHKENPFKIRSYKNAYITLRKLEEPLKGKTQEELAKIKGIGKNISAKIIELIETGEMVAYNKYKDITPKGVQEMLEIKGFGPKKVRILWKDLGAESVGEVWYACNENRLIALKGFGTKTQADLKQKIEYFLQSKDKFHYAALEKTAIDLIEILQTKLPTAIIELTGAIRRKCVILNNIEIIIGLEGDINSIFEEEDLRLEEQKDKVFLAKTANNIPVKIYQCIPNEFGSKQFRYTGTRPFFDKFLKAADSDDFKNIEKEIQVFEKAGLAYIEPELREGGNEVDWAKNKKLPVLIETKDIKGVIHSHTTYSDGLHSLEEMALAAKALGYEYIGITDHSKAAFYANGLKPDRVLQQMEEIDALNQKLAPFRILKGIESDILNDGSLDYEEAILKRFDFIIASVHTNLKMDEEKATNRLLTAIKNPYTSILGHPTGRLLLAREGYPLDHKKVIDACAKYGVSIELNANPHRLDLDWTWIEYATNQGVMISINPDAHSKEGIQDIHYGVLAARKGALTKAQCLNALDVDGFLEKLKTKN